MCQARNDNLLTNKDRVLSRYKEYFEQHPDLVDLRDDGIEIALPSREDIEET
jgi:hypothetical protein